MAWLSLRKTFNTSNKCMVSSGKWRCERGERETWKKKKKKKPIKYFILMPCGTTLEILALLDCIALLTVLALVQLEGLVQYWSVHYWCHHDVVMLGLWHGKVAKNCMLHTGAKLDNLMLYNLMGWQILKRKCAVLRSDSKEFWYEYLEAASHKVGKRTILRVGHHSGSDFCRNHAEADKLLTLSISFCMLSLSLAQLSSINSYPFYIW